MNIYFYKHLLNSKNVWTFNFWTYEIGWTCFYKDDVWTFFNLNYSFWGRCSNFFRANTCAPTQCSEHIFLTIDVQNKSFWTSIFEHNVQKLMFKLGFELTRTIFLNSFCAPCWSWFRCWFEWFFNDFNNWQIFNRPQLLCSDLSWSIFFFK